MIGLVLVVALAVTPASPATPVSECSCPSGALKTENSLERLLRLRSELRLAEAAERVNRQMRKGKK